MIRLERSEALSLAVLLGALLWALWPLLSGDATFFYGDAATHYAPQKALQGALLRQGLPPLWNAWLQLGEPLAGNPSLGIFYPSSALLYACFAPSRALSWDLSLHLILLGFGAWVWTHSWRSAPAAALIAGVAAAFSGVALSYTSNPQYLLTLAWLPWVLLLARRVGAGGGLRSAAALGGALALAFHAGDPQGATLQGLLAGFVVLARVQRRDWRRVASSGALAAVVALLVAAALAAPALELLTQSRRGAGLGLAEAGDWSFAWPRFLTLFLPEFFGLPAPDNTLWGHPLIIGLNNTRFWFFGISIGLVPWLGLRLGVPGNRRFHVALAVAALFLAGLALGTNAPLFPFIHAHIPGVASFRYPEKYLAPALLVLVLWAGLGLARAESRRHPTRDLGRAALVLGGLVLAAAGAVFWQLPGALGGWIDAWTLAPNAAAAREGVAADAARAGLHAILLMLGGMVLCVRRTRRFGLPLLALLTLFEALPRAQRLLYTADPSLLDAPTELGRILGGQDGRPPRIIRDQMLLDPQPWPRGLEGERQIYQRWKQSGKANFGLVEGFAYATGYSGLETPVARELGRGIAQEPVEHARRLAAPHVVSAPDPGSQRPVAAALLRRDLQIAHRLPRSTLLLLRVPDVRPAAELVYRAELGAGEVLPLGEAPVSVDSTLCLIGGRLGGAPLQALDQLRTQADSRPPLARADNWLPHRVRVALEPEDQGLLVLRDRFAPGWLAHDDQGNELPILRADGLFRGVQVIPGTRWIEFDYRPRALRWGGILSLIGTILALGCLLRPRSKRARRPRRP